MHFLSHYIIGVNILTNRKHIYNSNIYKISIDILTKLRCSYWRIHPVFEAYNRRLWSVMRSSTPSAYCSKKTFPRLP